MKKDKKNRIASLWRLATTKIFFFTCIGVILLIFAGYSTWNSLDPAYTCAQCHEIASSHSTWTTSAHADIQCYECHGTALSKGFHSINEKVVMVTTHFSDRKDDDIRLTEAQMLELVDRCIRCHRSEHAGWLASGHAVNYREIFMDSLHNAIEKPYWDCLRCHGMYYEGTINDLMNLDGEPSSWAIKNRKQELLPAIPCLACHQMHTANPVSKRYITTSEQKFHLTTDIGSSKIVSSKSSAIKEQRPQTSLYLRSDKIYLRSDKLTRVVMNDDGRPVNRAIDPGTLLCQQCHAPDYTHQAGSQDDKTPVGVHEGIGCTVCHQGHSLDTRQSCVLCHSEVSKNCKKDVRKMNTSYLSKTASNDIHRLTCTSCHEKK